MARPEGKTTEEKVPLALQRFLAEAEQEQDEEEELLFRYVEPDPQLDPPGSDTEEAEELARPTAETITSETRSFIDKQLESPRR